MLAHVQHGTLKRCWSVFLHHLEKLQCNMKLIQRLHFYVLSQSYLYFQDLKLFPTLQLSYRISVTNCPSALCNLPHKGRPQDFNLLDYLSLLVLDIHELMAFKELSHNLKGKIYYTHIGQFCFVCMASCMSVKNVFNQRHRRRRI